MYGKDITNFAAMYIITNKIHILRITETKICSRGYIYVEKNVKILYGGDSL